MSELPANIETLIVKLTESQILTNSTIQGFDVRLRKMEGVIEKEVYLTNSQLRELSKQIKNRVSEICHANGYLYNAASKVLFQAIYRSINGQYNVMSYRELPRVYANDILEAVKLWDVTEGIKNRLSAA